MTATGAALATITVPGPYGTFIGVTAAADNRTFVLWLRRRKLARLPLQDPSNPVLPAADRPGRLRPGQPGAACCRSRSSRPGGILALPCLRMPPGSRMTRRPVAHGTCAARLHRGHRGRAGVGRTRGRSGVQPGTVHGSLSWTAAGRTLALITSGGPPDSGVRLLDTAAPGSSLLASSRLVVPTPTDPADWLRQLLAPGRRSAPMARSSSPSSRSTRRTPPSGWAASAGNFVTFSAETGALLRTLNHILARGGYQRVLWAGSFSTAADRQRHPAPAPPSAPQPRAQCRYPQRRQPLHPHPVVQPHLRGRLAALTQRLPHRAGTDPRPPRRPIWRADYVSSPAISPLDAEYPPDM